MKYSDLKPGIVFVYEDQPYQVIKAAFLRKQQRKPVMQTEIKNLTNGKVLARNFHMNESFEEANLEKVEIKYLYNNKNEFWFSQLNDPSKRFKLDNLESNIQFAKENSSVQALKFNNEIITVDTPIKVDLKIKETAPNIKGNTASGGNKVAVLETGAKINVPMFIEAGDIIRVNTQEGKYVGRVKELKN